MDFSLSERHLAIQARAREAADEIVAPHARESDEQRIFRRDVIDELAGTGLIGLHLPTEMGGEGADNLALSLVYEELGRVDSSVRGFLTVQIGLISQCLFDWGTEDQKRYWLPRLGRAQSIGCYCLTEPEAGSDAASITTSADPTSEGWIINGVKHWITNGNVADVSIVLAKQDRDRGSRGITAFLVPTEIEGFHREPMPGMELGHRGSDHALVRFENVKVGTDAVLGAPLEGFKVAMSGLTHGRLGVAAGAVGILQACLDACLEFSRRRRQFGSRIGDFQMIQAIIANIAADLEAARTLSRQAAWMADQGTPMGHMASLAKLFATEAAVRAADQAVLLHGGRGYSSEYPVERFLRDSKGLQIYEGTSHIQRIIIARYLLGKDHGEL